MLRINVLAGLLVFSTSGVSAQTSSECLSHLGGATADVACYNGLSTDIFEANRIRYIDLKNRIPKNNRNRRLLDKYMLHSEQGAKFCSLIGAAANNWHIEIDKKMSEHRYDDVQRYACIYDLRLHQKNFLASLNKSIKN